MKDIPRSTKRALREYAGAAYEIALKREISLLSARFYEWKAGRIDGFELTEAIHKFHDGPARELYKQYAMAPSNMVDVLVASAIARKVLDRNAISPEVLEFISDKIAFFESDQ